MLSVITWENGWQIFFVTLRLLLIIRLHCGLLDMD